MVSSDPSDQPGKPPREALENSSASGSPARQGPRITRVTTRVGDGGQTQLVGDRWVSKSDPRLEACGAVDELQVAIGAARDALQTVGGASRERLGRIGEHVVYIQNLLFTLGGDLATPLDHRHPQMPLVRPEDVVYLERLIDACNRALPPLADFVLPGGHPAVTALHACRVVCRRAERAIERLAATEPIGETVRPFVNRLSDAFFVLARWVGATLHAAEMAEGEKLWRRDLEPPPMP
jgi:cob(I)alamin adenosyltransferase